jgi:hypothetical protein
VWMLFSNNRMISSIVSKYFRFTSTPSTITMFTRT